jgi:hypothetical protein
MKGMSNNELEKVTNFIQKFHHFGWISNEEALKIRGERFNLNIKYIESSYDIRTREIWLIRFRCLGNDLQFSTNHFTIINPPPTHFKFNNLFEWVMNFLKGEWFNSNILKECIIHK